MAMNLLTNRRKKTRGGSVYVDATQTLSAENVNQEAVGRPSIASDSRPQGDPTSAPTRGRTVEFNIPPTAENRHSRKVALGTTPADPQSLHPGKPEANGDGKPGDNAKGQGNTLETMQAKFTAAKSSRVWDTYVRKAEEEDKDLVEDWDRVIDVTLVFAALFSAISTGFLLESSKNLQPDQAKATVRAIKSLTTAIQAGINASTVPMTKSEEDLFQPTLLTIWVNCLWFLSLGLSISVSLFAMLAKRWCYIFRSKRTGTSHERALKRQKSWDAIERWKIELVIEQLPTLMHIALMLFFFGLVVYLAEIHQTTMIVTATLVGFTIVLYVILTVLPLWYQNCPLVTPFTRIILATYWYLAEGFKFVAAQFQSYFKSASILATALELYGRVSNLDWREILGAAASLPKKIFPWICAGIISLWKGSVGLVMVMPPFTKQDGNPSPELEWVIRGRTDGGIGNTELRPQPDEGNRHEFSALAWILTNSTDRETVKEVLDHITNFPDVILDSLADSDQLYLVASTVAEHLNRFQHDPAEWRNAVHINSSCARLIYLTTRPWLHKSIDYPSKYHEIRDLSYRYRQLGQIDMSPEDVDKQVSAIKERLTRLSEPVSWLENLAGKIVLGCTPGPGLRICAALGRTLLDEKNKLQARRLEAEVYPTLWWIFLNSVMDCTDNSWPSNQYDEKSEGIVLVTSDSVLALSHFRDSRKRQGMGLWLPIVGITGMLYAFTRFPDHEDGPAANGNDDYFAKLISFLRATLHNYISVETDPFLGDLPVYNGTEVRLYQFDSLQYGIDALGSAIVSPIYTDCRLSSDLSLLLQDLKQIKSFKDSLVPKPDRQLDYGCVLEIYNSEEWINRQPSVLFSAGVLLDGRQYYLPRERAHLFAKFLPDLIFGCSRLERLATSAVSKERVGMTPTTEQFIIASNAIASWAWMPFSTPMSLAKWKTKCPNYTQLDLIWEPLERVGLLCAPVDAFGVYGFFSDNYWEAENREKEGPKEAHRAAGYCLYIKASLLNGLYSFSAADVHSPNILAWSIVLAKHVAELLQFWDTSTFTSDEQIYIIGSLVQLTNTLLDALKHSTSLEPLRPSQGNSTTIIQSASADATDARGELEALIKAGILPVLARPFSPCFQPPPTMIERTMEKSEWHDGLARTIERLAQSFPSLHAEKNFSKAINDALRDFGRPEWMFNQDSETSGDNGDGGHKTPHNGSNEIHFYSDMVMYYEARSNHDNRESSPMLELVKHLRDDMEIRHQPPLPRAESPIEVRIDMLPVP